MARLGCLMLVVVACSDDTEHPGDGGAGAASATDAMSSAGGGAAGQQAGDGAQPAGGAGAGGTVDGGPGDSGRDAGSAGDDGAIDAGAGEGSDDDAGPPRVMDLYPGSCTDASDWDGDGAFNYRTISTYDDDGRLVRTETDTGADGDIDSIDHLEYDAEGRRVRIEHDRGADGTIDSVSAWEFRPDGQPLRDVDYNDVDDIVRIRAYDYDDRGFLIEIFESPGTGQRMQYENDDNGCAVVVIQDDGNDGVIDFHSTFTRDAECRELERMTDYLDDGTIDWTSAHTYDDAGNILSEQRTDEDGVVTYEKTREYDDGRLVREVAISLGNLTTTRYHYDAAGNLMLIETDPNDDGLMVGTRTFERDGRGNLLRAVTDEDGDGTPESIRESTYDCWE